MEELQKLYDVLVREGKYTKSFEEFKSKWSKDTAYKDKVYDVAVRDGLYTKDKNSFFQKYTATSISNEAPIQKKKFASESSSAVGSSALQESPKRKEVKKPTTEEFEAQFKQGMAKQKAVPKDLSGQPIIKPEVDKKLKTTFNKINNKVGSDKRISQALGKINSNLIGKEEEEVVAELSKDQTLKDLGFTFEESGALGDYVTVTAPDGKTTTEISLDNFLGSKSANQALALQKFIKDNTSKESRIALDKIVLKEEFEEKQIQEKKKKLGDIFDKQLGTKPKIDDSAYLNERLSSIDTDLINETEENVVAEMEYQFGDLGFKFEKTGVFGDYMKVIAPNGNQTEISLDNFLDSKSTKQADLLKGFIKTNTPAKGLFVLERTQKEEDKKFNSQKQVDDSIKSFSKELNDLNSRQKQFLAKKAQLDKQIKENGLTQELQNQGLALNEEMKTLLSEEENIKYKQRKLDAAVGKYTIMESKKGGWLGGMLNEFLEGSSSIGASITKNIDDLSIELQSAETGILPEELKSVSVDISKKLGITPPKENQTLEQWKKTLTEDQLDDWEDEVDDYKKKSLKDVYSAIRIGNRQVFGDRETTVAWTDLKKEGFWGGAILGLTRSLPAMIGGAGPAGWAQRTAQMYSQISDGLDVEMQNNPEFADISENEKLAITLPIGITSAVLEAYGLRNIKASKGVITNLTMRALGKTGTATTAKTFRELVENEVESALARGVLTITAAGVAEFETGAAQEATETGYKYFYNKVVKGKDMFKTPDSVADFVENIVVSGAQEAVGGFVLGVPTAVSAAYSKKGFLKMDDVSFEAFENMANDENMQTAYVTNLKNQITQGIITMSEAKTQLNDYRNAAGLYRQLPEGLNTQQKKEAMNLLKEKRDLQNYVEGKDNALVVKQKERITEIDNSLTKLSETDAVQEQSTTEVPVQSEAITSETMETGVSEPGPEVVTEKSTEEKIKDLEAELETITDDNNPRIAEIDAEINDLEKSEVVTEQPVQEEVAEPLKDIESTTTALETSPFDKIKKSKLFKLSGIKIPTKTDDFIRDAKDRTTNTEEGVNFSNILLPDGNTIFDKLMDIGVRDIELTNLFELFKKTIGRNSIDKTEQFKKDIFDLETEGTNSEDISKIIENLSISNEVSKKMQSQKNIDIAKEFRDTFEEMVKEGVLDKDLKPLADEIADSFENNKLINIDNLYDLVSPNQDYNWTNKMSEAYHIAKENGNNPELVKAVEELLGSQVIEPQVVSEVNELLDLDTTDQTSLERVLDYLNKAESALDLDPNELNDVTRVMAATTAKAVIKALKVLVNAGITLQEAIKRVSAEQKVTPDQIIEAMNIVSKINENKSEGISESELPGYNRMVSEVEGIVEKSKNRGASNDKIAYNVMSYVMGSKVYEDATDVQRDALVRSVRKRFGLKEKSAPSVGKLLGTIKDVTKITMREKDLLVKQIKDKAKGAKDAVAAFRLASEELAKEIKELKEKGNITATQAVNIISKFSKVNLFNETSVSNFVDYMSKVFADADYDNKINIAKSKIKNAKKNIATKIGIADGLAFPLQTLFSINPKLIPIKNLERYIELLNMFSERKEVLKLDEISQVTEDVNEILDEINNEQSLVPELADRLNNSDNKVTENGVLNYSDTVKKMLKEGDITQEEADLMVKYKNEINPQEGREKKTDAEIEAERKELESEVRNSTINANDLPTRDERTIAKKIAQYLKTPFIKQFTNSELKNLLKVIDNINNGYLPHQAELILEKLDGLSDGKIEANVIEKANLKKIAQLVNTTYNTIKSKITKKDSIFEMIRRTPLFNIDQILGNFKTEELFYALLGKSAKAEAKFSFELKTIQEKIKKAQDKVAKSFSLNPLESTRSSYKIKTYQLQLEYNSNPGDKRVNPAADYIKATIKHIKKLKSQYNENDVEILEKILKDFAPNGEIDIDKLYNSFNSVEKESIKLLQDLKNIETEKAEFTAAVIRGNRITPLNNYTHISVLSDNSNKDLDADISFANEYNESLRPSTKAKSLIERTPGAKPINFDAYSTALKSSKYVLMDYYLTAPIRTARKSIKAAEAELEKDGEMSKEQRRIFESINDAFELAVSDLVMNSYVQNSLGQDIVGFISKQGYRAVLAGLGKSSIELLSNLGYVVYDPFTFYKGMQYMGVLLSEDGSAIMNNSKSVQTNRVYASGLSGRMIDVGILNESVGTKSSKTRGKIASKAQQVWNLTIKRFIKNPVELTADSLISSPDKVIMRPYWLGSYITELENQLGRKVTNEDLKKIAENNEQYMSENEDAIEAATQVADRKSKLMGATKNGFTGLLRGKIRKGDEAQVAIIKNFNAFMTNFMVYEYNAAKTGVMAAIGDGTMSKSEGAAVLAGVITRMTVYNLLIKSASSGVAGLLGLAFGFDDEEEEEDKTLDQVVTQSLASTFSSLMLGRDFGNISKTAINYTFEEYVTKEYLEGLRTGEYDPYKDAILFNSLQPNERTGEIELWENIPNFMGSYGPMAKTAALGIKVLTADKKKTIKAKKRQEKERNIRLPLEILGNAGYIPLYKEVRKSVMNDIYKDLKKSGNKKVRVVKAGDEFK